MYEPRLYRARSTDGDLVSFHVAVRETDLYLRARRDLTEHARRCVVAQRGLLEDYIRRHPGFATAMEPFPVGEDAPELVREMAQAALAAGVGPMATVAGAIAERVGRELAGLTPEIIVENGGDIFLKTRKKRLVGIHAGTAALKDRLALEIRPSETPLGVCTSSGTIGHSLSLGRADAAIVLAKSTALADAAATAIGNVVREEEDVPRGIELARQVEGLSGAVVIWNDRLAIWGQVRLARV